MSVQCGNFDRFSGLLFTTIKFAFSKITFLYASPTTYIIIYSHMHTHYTYITHLHSYTYVCPCNQYKHYVYGNCIQAYDCFYRLSKLVKYTAIMTYVKLLNSFIFFFSWPTTFTTIYAIMLHAFILSCCIYCTYFPDTVIYTLQH